MVVGVIVMIVMMIVVIMIVAMVMAAIVGDAVSAAFGLKGSLDLVECCSETLQHFLNHVVGSDAQSAFANLGGQVAVSKMPGESHQLVTVVMPHFHQRLGGTSNPDPGSVVQLESVAVGHGNCLRQIKQDVLALVCRKTNAPSMTRVKIEGESGDSFIFRPVSCGAMNRGVAHGAPSS